MRSVLTGLLISCSLLSYAQQTVFKDKERVCFVGNSITNHGGFHHDIALFYATRYPSQQVNIINNGVSGNRAINVLNRMDSDVLVFQPNWAILKLGMNDVNKNLYTKEAWARPGIEEERKKMFEVLRKDYEEVIRVLLKNNCKIILQTPSIYDQTASIPGSEKLAGRNDGLKIAAGYVKEFGKKYKLPVVDYWTIMDDITKKVQAADSTATIISSDRVHPGATGHFIMAYQFLKTTGVQSYVSKILINAVKATSSNATVSNLRHDANGVTFTCLENSLPFPMPKGTDAALKLVPFSSELNSEILMVKGLTESNYQLKIDGNIVGTYSSQDLAKGIDLALNKNTPQFAQAQKVLKLFEEYWKLEANFRYIKGMDVGRFHGRKIYDLAGAQEYFDKAIRNFKDTTTKAYKDFITFRNTYLPGKARQDQTMEEMKAMQALIYKTSKPVTHRFEIVKDNDMVAASQAGASPLFFDAGDLPADKKPSDFKNDKELAMRNGLPNFFAKVKAGKPLTIAFIGGSVTQMDFKYRNQTAKYIKALYPRSSIKFMNAGTSGTGSDLGACRIGQQVLKYNPDLIFLDYAVNGSYLPGLEGIIRQTIKSNPQTDICLLYAIMSGQNQLYAQGTIPDNILKLETVADYYQLPAIQLGWEPSLLEAAGKLVFKPDPKALTDKPVFSDGIHPTEFGGWIYAGAIARSLNKMQLKATAEKHVLPEPMMADNWEDGKMLDPSEVNFSKEWKKTDPLSVSNLKQFAPWFPYVMESETPGASFSFSFYGTRIGVFDIGGPEVGQLDVEVDGKIVKSINRFNGWCNNRYRGQYEFIEVPDGEHRVRFIISENIPDKKAILGPSKSEDITAHPEKYNRRVVYLGKVLIKGTLIKN